MKASHFILAEAFLEIQTLSMTAIQFGTRRGKRREIKKREKEGDCRTKGRKKSEAK